MPLEPEPYEASETPSSERPERVTREQALKWLDDLAPMLRGENPTPDQDPETRDDEILRRLD
jgi:hypothetical protein